MWRLKEKLEHVFLLKYLQYLQCCSAWEAASRHPNVNMAQMLERVGLSAEHSYEHVHAAHKP